MDEIKAEEVIVLNNEEEKSWRNIEHLLLKKLVESKVVDIKSQIEELQSKINNILLEKITWKEEVQNLYSWFKICCWRYRKNFKWISYS